MRDFSKMVDQRKIALVTGANGFLSRTLIPLLIEEGWRVIGVSREKATATAYQTITWEEFWSGAFFDPQHINFLFHLAAYIPPNMEDPACVDPCMKANAELTLNLAEYIAAHTSARFIYCSGGLVQGAAKTSLTDHAHALSLHRACFYLLSKLVGEVYVERTRKLKGLDSIIFRVGSCYGPLMPERSMVSRFSHIAKLGHPLPLRNGGGEQFDMVYALDVAQLLLRGAKSSKNGIFNASSGNAVTVREVAEAVNKTYGNKAGVVVEDFSTTTVQTGFASMPMARTTKAFAWQPRDLSRGLEDFRSWLELNQQHADRNPQ